MIEYIIIGVGIIDVVLITYCVWIHGGITKMVWPKKKQPELTPEQIEKHPRFAGGDVIKSSPKTTEQVENVDEVTLAIRQINEILPRVSQDMNNVRTDEVILASMVALVVNTKK